MFQLTFHGAAQTVTGSKALLEADNVRAMVDCGLFQGLKSLRERNWAPPEYRPESIDALLLTHAHIDHSGYLPRLVRQGFAGPIYVTPPTREVVELLLYDSAKIQEEDARWLNEKSLSKHTPALPLYDCSDVDRTLPLFQVRDYDEWFPVAGDVRARFRDIGHLIGSAMIDMDVEHAGKTERILWSGDVGRYGMPLNADPTPPAGADYLVVESTYGNRSHPHEPALVGFEPLIRRMLEQRSILLVPAFAVGRAQQVIYIARELIHQRRVPEFPIYLDSPMAVDATRIYCKYPENHTVASERLQEDESCVLNGPNVHLCRTTAESKALNNLRGPALVISSSGMLTGGRILHHLKHRLPDPSSTVALVGYQADGTRGRSLQQGAKVIKIHGEMVPVRAHIADLGSLSGHADRDELLRWLSDLPRAPKRVFVTHGEKDAAVALAESLRREHGWDVRVPELGQHFDL